MSFSSHSSETAIWERVIHPERGDLPREAAMYFLNLAFEAGDLDRIHELAVKNQDGTLTADEVEALRNYRQVGLQLDLLRSKARLAIGQPPVS
jgi:hypothetical protein